MKNKLAEVLGEESVKCTGCLHTAAVSLAALSANDSNGWAMKFKNLNRVSPKTFRPNKRRLSRARRVTMERVQLEKLNSVKFTRYTVYIYIMENIEKTSKEHRKEVKVKNKQLLDERGKLNNSKNSSPFFWILSDSTGSRRKAQETFE